MGRVRKSRSVAINSDGKHAILSAMLLTYSGVAVPELAARDRSN